MKDGGPAFPVEFKDFQPTTGDQVVREQMFGMSLRDWFAGMALQGIMAAFASPEHVAAITKMADAGSREVSEQIARLALASANAMLKERERP